MFKLNKINGNSFYFINNTRCFRNFSLIFFTSFGFIGGILQLLQVFGITISWIINLSYFGYLYIAISSFILALTSSTINTIFEKRLLIRKLNTNEYMKLIFVRTKTGEQYEILVPSILEISTLKESLVNKFAKDKEEYTFNLMKITENSKTILQDNMTVKETDLKSNDILQIVGISEWRAN
ncbi:membrane protein [Candidatus Magnetomorum sp. HK-1]|nr:membrane protein [Candidatus Magnetomorum sp. HK-1]